MTTERIRPRQGPQQSDPALRAEAEAGESGIARAPDLLPAQTVDVGPGTIVAQVFASPTVHPSRPPAPAPFDAQGPLSAEQAAAARLTHGQPNRLGRPAEPNLAEQVLANYQTKRQAWKAEYAATRQHSGQAWEELQEAKNLMCKHGLMDPDSAAV